MNKNTSLALVCLHIVLALGLHSCAPTTYVEVSEGVFKIEKKGCVDSTELANKANVVWIHNGILSDTMINVTDKPAYLLVKGEQCRLFSYGDKIYVIVQYKPIDSPSWEYCYEFKRVRGLRLGAAL